MNDRAEIINRATTTTTNERSRIYLSIYIPRFLVLLDVLIDTTVFFLCAPSSSSSSCCRASGIKQTLFSSLSRSRLLVSVNSWPMNKPWIVLALVFGLVTRTGQASAIKRRKSSRDCYAELQCGGKMNVRCCTNRAFCSFRQVGKPSDYNPRHARLPGTGRMAG